MKNTIKLSSESFKYPTREERKAVGERIPKVNHLRVEYKSAAIEILQDSTYENAIRNEDVYWWNHCLDNRLGKLTETCIYVQTHFLRIQESGLNESIKEQTDRILLDYYIEIFYYYFFSTRDVLGQLLNIIFDLAIEENKIFLNELFVEKIKSGKVKGALSDFLKNTKDSYNIRNSFNHRFTPTQQDFRAKRNMIKVDNQISFYSAEEVNIETFILDIENLMKHLSKLMDELRKEIK